jgi:hypothetical protein
LNASDKDDRWFASINVIFDAGAAEALPVDDDRDFDLVIQLEKYKQDGFSDKPKEGDGSYWWFARNADNTIKPFTLHIDNEEYQWAVRYKFFYYPPGDSREHANDKVHIKFIPVDNDNVAPFLDHPLKRFVDCTVDYLDEIPNLPATERALAEQKIAAPDLWIKRISAGYEIYSGNCTLGNEYFLTVIDNQAPVAPTNLTASKQNSNVVLDWNDHSDESFEAYSLYRSENEGAFTLIESSIYQSNYVDNTVMQGAEYEYYVTTLDRSYNESLPSVIENVSVIDNLSVTGLVSMYPNPTTGMVNIDISDADFTTGTVNIINTYGATIETKILTNREADVNLQSYNAGLYFIVVSYNNTTVTKSVVKN